VLVNYPAGFVKLYRNSRDYRFYLHYFSFFSVTWYEKKGWKKAVIVLLVIFGVGSIVDFGFNWGIQNYPVTTLISMPIIIIVLILLYIKYVEPKVLKRGKEMCSK
jgi:hypothetical protein